MNLYEAIGGLLIADAGLAALVADRVYQGLAPQETPFPYLVIEVVSSPGSSHSEAAAEVANTIVQIDVFARTTASRHAVREAVRGALDGFQGESASVDLTVTLSNRGTDLTDDLADGSEEPVFRSLIEASVWHAVSVPSFP